MVHLKRAGLLPKARGAIERVRDAGGYVSERAISAAIQAAGEG
jgi:hypothetical protein